MHLSYNELHRQVGKLSFCHRNITENHNIEDQQQQLVFTTNFAPEFAYGKILLMDFSLSLFQGSKMGDKLLLRFYTVTSF